MLYFLSPPVDKYDSMIALKENAKQVKRYFLWERDNGAFLESCKVQFEVLSGYTIEEVQDADYLIVESEMFVISTKAYDTLHEFIKEDVHLYPVDVHCGDTIFDFYIGKINTRRPIIDKNKSSFTNLPDGDIAITDIVYADDLDEDFYLARDVIYNNRYAASDKLIELLNTKKLKIIGVPHPTS